MTRVALAIACAALAAACTHTRPSATPQPPLGMSTAPGPANPDVPNPDAAGVPLPSEPTPPVNPPITSTYSTAAPH